MQIDIPSGIPVKWFSFNQVSEKTWITLKAKLTGKKQPDGKSYYSEVKLSDKEADTIIRNIKKDFRGFPLLEEDKTKNFDEDNKKYQEWLVEQYLKNEPDIPDIVDQLKNDPTPSTPPTNESIYEGTRGDDLVEEEIDPDLIKRLGLEDTSEMDYEDYSDLISERLLEGSWPDGKKIAKKHLNLLKKELDRVKDKTNKFKLKPARIATSRPSGASVARALIPPQTPEIEPPSPSIAPEGDVGRDSNNSFDALMSLLTTIKDSTTKILEVLSDRNKLYKKREDDERKRAENLKRQKREESLEKGIDKITSTVSALLAPVQGIIDKIINFIVFTLLGRAFTKFLEWFRNPKNAERVETLKRFLKDWWPAILGAIVLFTTPFGKFVRSFIGLVTKLTLRLSRFAIPKLIRLIGKNPKTAVAIGAAGAAAGIGMYMQSRGKKQDEELQSVDPNYGKEPSMQKGMLDIVSSGGVPAFKGGGLIPFAKAFMGGGEQTSLQPFEGGFVDDTTGLEVVTGTPDTRLTTVLQPGEVVFSKKAVDYWGADRLLMMNKMGGGTNIPKFVNNIQMAQGGGMIGGMTRGIGRLFGTNQPKPKMDFKSSWHGPAPKYEYKAREAQAFLKALRVAEGTIKSKNSYDTIYGGKEIPIRQMTVKEVIQMQRSDMLPKRFGGGRAPWPDSRSLVSRASGAYQFMPDTLQQLIKMKVLKPSDKMTPDTQDRAAWALARMRGLSVNQLRTKGLTRNALDTVAAEWASLPNLEGKSYYGQPVKKPELLQKVYSDSLKLGPPVKVQPPSPPVSNQKISFVDLPPIIQKEGRQIASAEGTEIPDFMPPDSIQMRINSKLYGIG